MALHAMLLSDALGAMSTDAIRSIELIANKTEIVMSGSRFFGIETEDSDWDFVMLDFYDSKKFLENQGFERITDSSYRDLLVRDVYRHTYADPFTCIDIQVISPFRFLYKIFAQYNIRANMTEIYPLWEYLGKEDRHILWNYTIDTIINSGQNKRYFDHNNILECLKAIRYNFKS